MFLVSLSSNSMQLYAKLLGKIIWHHGMRCYQYADDTQINISIPVIQATLAVFS